MVKELNFVVGNDNGNSEHDIIIDGTLIREPNVYAKVRQLPLLEQLKEDVVLEDIEKNLIVSVSGSNVEPGVYLVGAFALNSGATVRSIEVGVDNNKIESNIVLVNTLAQIAGYGCKTYYKEKKSLKELEKDELVINVDMATALPIKQYTNDKAKQFSDKFEGVYDVILHVGAYKPRIKINIKFVKTIPEGVTASWALLQEENNHIFEEYNNDCNDKISNKTFKSAKVLHVSIGEGTTELPVTTGIEFDPNFIKGIDNGIGHAIDKSLEEFNKQFGLTNYSRQKFSEVMQNEAHKYFAHATDIAADYIEEQAEQILHAVKQEVLKANNEIDYIVVYGGGSILMRDFLESKLKPYVERAKIKLLYIPESDAVTLETKGLYAFATSKIFSSIKSKSIK